MKKIISVLLCAAMLLSFSAITFATDGSTPLLQFDDKGEFKILHLCDCQDVYPAAPEMIEYICQTLDTYKPDLVVLGGDNSVAPAENKSAAIAELVKPFVDRGIPFTLVFGNHDDEQGVNEETLLQYYQLHGKGYCLAFDADSDLSGCATHLLTVMSKNSATTPAYNLWMFDSNSYETNAAGASGYSCVQPDQIEWYKAMQKQSEALAGKKLPAMAFQHIIVGEIMDVLYPTVSDSVNLGSLTKFCNDKNYLLIPNVTKIKGQLFETPCPGITNYGQLDAFSEQGDVIACFSGHDHVNEFSVNIKGVDIVNTPGATFNSYAQPFNRGSRLITIHENSREYESEIILTSALALEDGSKITDSGENLSKFVCVAGVVLRKIFNSVLSVIQIFA